MIRNIECITLSIILIGIIIYFTRIQQKSNRIVELNKALEIKNNELRKIKHDYGAQISYLYGLHLMNRVDDLEKALKKIIDNNEATSSAVEITQNGNSILSLALKPAIDKGIHVIIEEKCDLQLISMSEMELYKIISNIIDNAIISMNDEGIIIAKVYQYLGNVVIKIENSIPRLDEKNIKDILKLGLVAKTKNDEKFKLCIVNELVGKYNGKVCIKDTDSTIEFKVILPIK